MGNLKNTWLYFKGDKTDFILLPKDRDFEVLFDNGDILKFSSDDFPFSEIIAWRELEQTEK